MASFTYTATRNLKTGHSADTEYVITLNLQAADEDITPKHAQHIALSGNTVTVGHRIDQVISITTDYINASTTPDIDDMLEFIHSTAHGETFTYNDGSAKTCIMQGDARRSKNGLYYTWTFAVRVQA